MLGHDFCEQRNCINFDDYRKREVFQIKAFS